MLFSISSFPQKIKTVDGEYTYVVPETVDLEKAKSIALERIKIQLIAEEFGTTVSQSNSTFVKNENGKSNIDFAENGGYPPTQNGDIRSLFWLFSLMALQN